MKSGPKFRAILCLSILGIVLGGCCSSAPRADNDTAESTADSSNAAVKKEVTSLLMTQRDAWNRRDIEGFMDGYMRGDGLVFTSNSNVRRGWQATLDGYRRSYTPETMGHLTFSNLEITPMGRDAAWILGRWKLDGLKAPAGGVFTLVVRRIGGRMLVVHDHTSKDETK